MPEEEIYNIFISWSGKRSKWIGESLREWLPLVVQTAVPWMSATDIDKGSLALNEISGKLQKIRVGISCLTPENLSAPWLLYEAGSLAKAIDDRPRLCTYLLAGLRPEDVGNPLGMFQSTAAEKEDTRRMVHTINRAVSEKPVPEPNLNQIFEKWWPDLEEKIKRTPAAAEAAPKAARTVDEIAAELLEFARAEASGREKILDKLFRIEAVVENSFLYNTAFRPREGAFAALGSKPIKLASLLNPATLVSAEPSPVETDDTSNPKVDAKEEFKI